jgi:hypothetical protein
MGQLEHLAEDNNLLAVVVSHLPLRDRLAVSRACSGLCQQVYQAHWWSCLWWCSTWHTLPHRGGRGDRQLHAQKVCTLCKHAAATESDKPGWCYVPVPTLCVRPHIAHAQQEVYHRLAQDAQVLKSYHCLPACLQVRAVMAVKLALQGEDGEAAAAAPPSRAFTGAMHITYRAGAFRSHHRAMASLLRYAADTWAYVTSVTLELEACPELSGCVGLPVLWDVSGRQLDATAAFCRMRAPR